MFSYIFMKVLEKRPERYDTGINILSGGHAEKIRKQINAIIAGLVFYLVLAISLPIVL